MLRLARLVGVGPLAVGGEGLLGPLERVTVHQRLVDVGHDDDVRLGVALVVRLGTSCACKRPSLQRVYFPLGHSFHGRSPMYFRLRSMRRTVPRLQRVADGPQPDRDLLAAAGRATTHVHSTRQPSGQRTATSR